MLLFATQFRFGIHYAGAPAKSCVAGSRLRFPDLPGVAQIALTWGLRCPHCRVPQRTASGTRSSRGTSRPSAPSTKQLPRTTRSWWSSCSRQAAAAEETSLHGQPAEGGRRQPGHVLYFFLLRLCSGPCDTSLLDTASPCCGLLPVCVQMQQCGQPPQEIVDELAPGMQVRQQALVVECGDVSNAVMGALAPIFV